jgi:hypothetical protein
VYDPPRILPVEISVSRGEDGSVVLVYEHEGRIIREIPFDTATAQQLIEQLLAAIGSQQPRQIDEPPAPDPEPIPATGVFELMWSYAPNGFAVLGKPGQVTGPLRPGFHHIGVDADENVIVVMPDGTVRKTGRSLDQMLEVFGEAVEKSGRHKAGSLTQDPPKPEASAPETAPAAEPKTASGRS